MCCSWIAPRKIGTCSTAPGPPPFSIPQMARSRSPRILKPGQITAKFSSPSLFSPQRALISRRSLPSIRSTNHLFSIAASSLFRLWILQNYRSAGSGGRVYRLRHQHSDEKIPQAAFPRHACATLLACWLPWDSQRRPSRPEYLFPCPLWSCERSGLYLTRVCPAVAPRNGALVRRPVLFEPNWKLLDVEEVSRFTQWCKRPSKAAPLPFEGPLMLRQNRL